MVSLVLALITAVLPAPALPVHATVLSAAPAGTYVVRLDPITNEVPAQTRRVRIPGLSDLTSGVGVDAFLDRRGDLWELRDAEVAARFAPGLPDPGKVIPLDYGSPLPHTRLVDQRGRVVDLARELRGRVGIISFVFTRCPDHDECPTVSAKFGELQRMLDPRFHLVEITLDPVYDSPAVLRAYGKQFRANPARWSLLTGRPQDIAHLLNRFGISSLRTSDSTFVHNDKVFLSAPNGRVAGIVQTIGFDPSGMAAQARAIAGVASNPFERFKLSLIAGVSAFCGGSQYAGVVLLEVMLFLGIAIVSFVTLAWVARKFWTSAP